MEIAIVRGSPAPWGIDGHLYINRERVCDTVEHPTKHLPSGEYQISLPFKEGPGLDSPFKHGDGAMGCTKGEIIVGKHLLPGVVTQSRATYQRLYERIRKARRRGSPIRLKIVG